MLHPLDLPNIRQKPSSTQLWSILDSLRVYTRNFEPAPPLEPHILNWLSRLASSDLDWLDADDADHILDFASKRIAQSCGIASRSSSVRILDVGQLEIKLNEPGLTDDNIGHKTWGSCLVLANRLLKSPQLLTGKVMELGSGTGLCGMIAAHLGHESLLTDLPVIVENIQTNIALNSELISASCTCQVLDWSSPTSPRGHYNTLIISDPVYSAKAPLQIRNTLAVLGIPRLLLQLPLRPKFEDLRQELYQGISDCGYTRRQFIEEDGMDDFGPSKYVFSLWERSGA